MRHNPTDITEYISTLSPQHAKFHTMVQAVFRRRFGKRLEEKIDLHAPTYFIDGRKYVTVVSKVHTASFYIYEPRAMEYFKKNFGSKGVKRNMIMLRHNSDRSRTIINIAEALYQINKN